MSEAKTIYVVTHGDYSAYSIDGLFSTRKKAEEWIEHTMDPSYYQVEEYIVDGEQPDRDDKLFEINIDYETFDARIIGRHYVNYYGAEDLTNTIRMTDSMDVKMYIVTDGPKRALKIASERLAQVKAEEWRYPLLHTHCEFATEEMADSVKRGLRGHVLFPSSISEYPAYRFGTGEMVIPKGWVLMDYTLIDNKEDE